MPLKSTERRATTLTIASDDGVALADPSWEEVADVVEDVDGRRRSFVALTAPNGISLWIAGGDDGGRWRRGRSTRTSTRVS